MTGLELPIGYQIMVKKYKGSLRCIWAILPGKRTVDLNSSVGVGS
ncbi:MAG: hypothetical protein ACBR12_06490 [Microcoleus sp.]